MTKSQVFRSVSSISSHGNCRKKPWKQLIAGTIPKSKSGWGMYHSSEKNHCTAICQTSWWVVKFENFEYPASGNWDYINLLRCIKASLKLKYTTSKPSLHRHKLGIVNVHIWRCHGSHFKDFHGTLSARHKDRVWVARGVHWHRDEIDACAAGVSEPFKLFKEWRSDIKDHLRSSICDHQMFGAKPKLTTKHWQKSARTGPWPGSFHVNHVINHYVYVTYWSCSCKKGKNRRSPMSWTTKSYYSQQHSTTCKLNPSGWSFQPAYKPITKSSAQSGWKDSVSDFLSVKRNVQIKHNKPSAPIPETYPQIHQSQIRKYLGFITLELTPTNIKGVDEP